MKRHILGMAKSNLDTRGAKSPKLELDLLRLIYTIKELRSAGDQAKGYLLVMTQKIAGTVEGWIDKYQGRGLVEVIVVDIAAADLEDLLAEKKNNVVGMVAGSLGEAVRAQSNAVLGRYLGEKALREIIGRREPGVVEMDKAPSPFGIQWDFYGQVEIS